MECSVAIVWIHDYLDGELPAEKVASLKKHLAACPSCQARFEQLERTEALTRAALDTPMLDKEASRQLTNRIMAQLPTSRRRKWTRMVRNHPAITVAIMFALIMVTSFVAIWERNTELVVRGSDLQEIVIKGNQVIVPPGAYVNGSLTVENGNADVQGEVEGDVIVIDGSLNLASTAHIAGKIRMIDQALDWFWYKVTETVSGLTP